jgi:nucleoside 2-deoxyribosyltransferase
MDTFKSFSAFLDRILPEIEYTWHPINGDNSNYTSIVLRKGDYPVIRNWSIENTLMHSKEIGLVLASKLKTLFYNEIWLPDNSKVSSDSLSIWVADNFDSVSVTEKMNNVLRYLLRNSSFPGDRINIDVKSGSLMGEYWRELFFQNEDEFIFYIEANNSAGNLEYQAQHNEGFAGIGLTIKGINEVSKFESEKNSNQCFVAMSFSEEMLNIYEKVIKPVIKESGFIPLIISENNKIPSDTTINDAILAAIKKSHFTISDFTHHRHGVYFEAGYALGRGQKVIYMCKDEHIKDAHFDTRNYQHIVWKDEEDLKLKLRDKIEVFIKG